MGSTMVDRLDRAGELTGAFKVAEWPEGRARNLGAGAAPLITFDGEFIWVAVASTNSVVKLDSDGVMLGEYAVGRWPTAVLVAGGSVWVTNFLDNSVSRLGMDGSPIETIPVQRGPHALLAVEDTLWVANFQGDSISVLSMQ